MVAGRSSRIREEIDVDYCQAMKMPILANLIDGLTANKQKLQENIENSPVIVTLLTPKIGYLKSAELFKESLKTGKTIRELVVSKKLMSNKEIDSLFK